MTSIKPPGGSPPPVTPDSLRGARETAPTSGPGFAERLGAGNAAQGPHGASGTPGAGDPTRATGTKPADPSQAVIADLRAGRIGPGEAVQALTDLAVRKSGAPASMRPAIEQRLRELLSTDPLVKDLLRQMGVPSPSEP